jgi:hypothetical protein
VLEKLVEWAAAVELSSNQPVFPHAVVVFNASENIDPTFWDVEATTTELLESLAGTIDENLCFKKYAGLWRDRGKQIKSIDDLIMCYYSSLRVSPNGYIFLVFLSR